MEKPIKIIHRFKNNNRRIQYNTYIFIGNILDDNIYKILDSIKNKDLYDTINFLPKKNIDILTKQYGEYWYKYFFNKYHIKKQINDILKNIKKRNNIENKMKSQWFNKHFKTFSIKKTDYSFAANYYDFLLNKNKIKEKKVKKEEMNFVTYQSGGGEINIDEEIKKEDEDTEKEKTADDIDEEVIEQFDLEELTNLYSMESIEKDSKLKETAKLISNAINDKKWLKEETVELEFDKKKDNLPYDSKLEEEYTKLYIIDQFIYHDDTVKNIRNKISVSIPLSDKFSDNIKLLPEYQYFWTEYNLNNKIDYVMLGQKWIRRNELLKIDIKPNDNLNVYENLRGNLSYLRESFGIKLRRENDENLVLNDYENFMTFNEIYMSDLFNEIGLNYKSDADKQRNLYEVFINIYYPTITFKRFEEIIGLLNSKNEIEINKNENSFNIIKNDIKIENEIFNIVEETKREKEKYNKMFSDNYILQTIIHLDLTNSKNLTGTVSDQKLNLYKIFDSFIVNEEYPFIQYQTPDTQITYKFYDRTKKIDDNDILSKWFETAPYGISFKIKSDNKFISINLNENGKMEYKITFKEIEKATIDNIKESYKYVNNLLLKINSENKKIKIILPNNSKYKYAFINTIQKFSLPNKLKINHNDLSDFSRFFYPLIALVIEPKKRTGGDATKFSKYGTYLRYKRISNYENKIRMHLRMLYFLRYYEITDKELVNEIAKQFNLTLESASYELDQVKSKYGNVLTKVNKKLQKIQKLPNAKPPGIGIDIQGRTIDNYKIRITGARSKQQLVDITSFVHILLFLYIETYLYKKSKYDKIKKTLLKLNNIAKRRNMVNHFVNYEKSEKEIKVIRNLDKKRLGFRPEEGQNQWSRSCQNSGEQRRQPLVISDKDIQKLTKRGYKLNSKSGFYEKKIIIKEKGQKRESSVKAIKLPGDDGQFIYYTCDPDLNNEYRHIGFLSKSSNPNELCMPCCFKKDQKYSNNLRKKNYYNKCIGQKNTDNKIERDEITQLTDKIYVLQETNKVQEGRFIFLTKYLNQMFNKIWNHDFKMKNRYLIESNSGYFLKFTIKDRNYNFLAALSNIYNIDIDQIKKNAINYIKNNNVFYYLNNGDIASMFNNEKEYIHYINNSNYLEYDIMGELLSLPNVLTKNGISYFIIKKKIKIIKKKLEKDEYQENYFLECLNLENPPNKENDIVILLKDGKYYFPIVWVQKKNKDNTITIVKSYNYKNYPKIIDELFSYYNKSCYNEFIQNINSLSNFTAKQLNKKFKIKEQIIDNRNKVRYIYININNEYQIIPTKPSGTILNIKIVKLSDMTNKYYNNIDKTIKLLHKIKLDPILIYYNNYSKKQKYNVISLLLKNKLIIPIKQEEMTQGQFKKYGLSYDFQSLTEQIDDNINNNNIINDDRLVNVKERLFRNEGYNLFRLELSFFINKNYEIKDKIINIVHSNISKSLKKKELLLILNDITNKKIKKNNRYITFIDVVNKLPNLTKYNISNIRDYCHTNKKCNNTPHCIFSNNDCRFRLFGNYINEYFQRIIEEMVLDKIKFKEIIQEDDYFVSDIVDYTQYSNRPNQKIIKTTNFNIKKIMENLFGKNNLPQLGKRSIGKKNTSIEQDYPELIKIGKKYIQEIIENKDTIVRAYINSYFWLNNTLYDKEFRNLQYYSGLQEQITNLFKANLIDYILNNTFNKEFTKDLEKYIDLKEGTNFFLSAINRFRKNKYNTNGIVELIVLSYMFRYPIIIYDNFNKVKYIFSNGMVKINENTIKKYQNIKEIITLKFDYDGSNSIPHRIYSIYNK